MPSKGKSKVTHSQRTQMATGRLSGKTIPVIAQETGLAESTVKRQIMDTRTLTLIQVLKEKHRPRLEELYSLALTACKRSLKQTGDLPLALAAAGRAVQLINAGDPPLARLTDPAHDLPPGDFLVEEALLYYRKIERGED